MIQHRQTKFREKKIGDIGKKNPDTSGLVTTIVLKTKISDLEKKISNTTSLVTTTVLNTKIGEVENSKIKFFNLDKHINTPEFNKSTPENFAARLKQADSVKKTNFYNKLTSLINKLLQLFKNPKETKQYNKKK